VVTGATHKPTEPYELGWIASADKKKLTDNPYPRGTDAYQFWLEGWVEGERDWIEVCRREVSEGRPHPEF
jgi:hypothetical protein